MKDERKQKLTDLGAEPLAAALLELTIHSDAADQLVDRLIATPKENIQRFKKKVTALKRSKRFIHWRESARFARELEMLLDDLQAGVSDPFEGFKLVASFYETDNSIFERCDDSSGNVGEVFRFHARKLFVEYGLRCSDKKKVADIILKATRRDDYGIRDILIDCAGEIVPEAEIRAMIATIQKRADGEADTYEKRHHLRLIESLARQIKDAGLFEKTRIANWEKLPTAALIDIAQVYLESGDVQTAYGWLKKIPAQETFLAEQRDALLSQTYRQLGKTDKLTDLLYRKFRAQPSLKTLEELLDIIGEDRRQEVVTEETSRILARSSFGIVDIQFLLSLGKAKEAEEYLVPRAAQVNGNFYDSLLPLAKTMEQERRFLAAAILYRSLLISILKRGHTKAYPHGVRYLRKLDSLAPDVTDWKGLDNHEDFKDSVVETHGRKHSFWSRYTDQK